MVRKSLPTHSGELRASNRAMRSHSSIRPILNSGSRKGAVLRAGVRIAEAPQELRRAAFERRGRQHRHHLGQPVQAGVLVAGDVLAARASRIDRFEGARSRARRRTIARGEVRDLQGTSARRPTSNASSKASTARKSRSRVWIGVIAAEPTGGAGEHDQLVGRARQPSGYSRPDERPNAPASKASPSSPTMAVELGRRAGRGARPSAARRSAMCPTSVATLTAGRGALERPAGSRRRVVQSTLSAGL